MSFAVFRKYEKPIMWATVIFSVLIFATFSGFGDLKALLSRNAADTYGQFELQSTGETRAVHLDEFQRVRLALNRFAYAQRRQDRIEDSEVWRHIILREEARAAGLEVSDRDVNAFISPPGQPLTREQYTQLWRDMLQFPSAQDMEAFLREQLEGQRWIEYRVAAAGLVTADEIYLQWRQDNERFDFDAVVIPDVPLDQIAAPSEDELKTTWDALSVPIREATYAEPRRLDVAYAFATLEPGEHGLPDEKLADVPEPPADEVETRWQVARAQRFPTATELTDEIRATLVREAKVVAAVQRAHEAFEAGEDKSLEAFTRAMEAAGLGVQDPVGLLDKEGLAALPDIGSESLWLDQTQVGGTEFGDPSWQPEQKQVNVVYVQAEQPARPLSFEEAREQLVKTWKTARVEQPAKDWRDALRKAARERPECVVVIQPLIDAATKRADEAAAAMADATDEARAERRKEVLDQAENTEILPKVREFEHLVWDEVPRPEGARLLNFTGISRSYRQHPLPDEAATSIERRLKTAFEITRLAVNSVSDSIRNAPSSETAVALVRARSFPEQTDMSADATGLAQARQRVSAQRERETRMAMMGDAVAVSHKLKVADLDAIHRERKDQPAVPPDA